MSRQVQNELWSGYTRKRKIPKNSRNLRLETIYLWRRVKVKKRVFQEVVTFLSHHSLYRSLLCGQRCTSISSPRRTVITQRAREVNSRRTFYKRGSKVLWVRCLGTSNATNCNRRWTTTSTIITQASMRPARWPTAAPPKSGRSTCSASTRCTRSPCWRRLSAASLLSMEESGYDKLENS